MGGRRKHGLINLYIKPNVFFMELLCAWRKKVEVTIKKHCFKKGNNMNTGLMRFNISSLPALCWSIQYEIYSTIVFVCDY